MAEHDSLGNPVAPPVNASFATGHGQGRFPPAEAGDRERQSKR